MFHTNAVRDVHNTPTEDGRVNVRTSFYFDLMFGFLKNIKSVVFRYKKIKSN